MFFCCAVTLYGLQKKDFTASANLIFFKSNFTAILILTWGGWRKWAQLQTKAYVHKPWVYMDFRYRSKSMMKNGLHLNSVWDLFEMHLHWCMTKTIKGKFTQNIHQHAANNRLELFTANYLWSDNHRPVPQIVDFSWLSAEIATVQSWSSSLVLYLSPDILYETRNSRSSYTVKEARGR